MNKLIAFFIFSAAAFAQNTTTITATQIHGSGIALLATGKLCFTPVDDSGNPQGYRAGGGGQGTVDEKCATVTNGAIGSWSVDNPDFTSPLHIKYTIRVLGTGDREIRRDTAVDMAGNGGTWSYDLMTPAGGGTPLGAFACPTGQVVSGITSSGQLICSVGGSGVTSLNTLTAATQIFANDTNVGISSNTATHTITWTGALAKARQHAMTAYFDGTSQSFTGENIFAKLTGGTRTGFEASLQTSYFDVSIHNFGALNGAGAFNSVLNVAWQDNTLTPLYPFYTVARCTHTSGNKGECQASGADAFNSNGGTLDLLAGVYGSAHNDVGTATNIHAVYGQVFSAGTTTNAATFHALSPSITGGTTTNAFGLLVDDITGASNNYAIKTGLGLVSFGDNVSLTAGKTVTATTFIGALTGNSTTATSLAANGTNCGAGLVPLGIDASGNAEGCYTQAFSNLSGSVTGAQMPALTGDVTSSAGTVATTLATVNSNVGTFTKLTVNGKGLVTAASNLAASDLPAHTHSGGTQGGILAIGTAVPDLTGAVTTSGSSATTAGKADVLDASSNCADAGANDTYACNLAPAITSYVTGVHYRFKANTANTGAATINFNAQGAKTIKKAAGGITTDLADNDIRVGQWLDLVYDGTNMQMQSTLGNAASGSGTTVQVAGSGLAGTTGNFNATTPALPSGQSGSRLVTFQADSGNPTTNVSGYIGGFTPRMGTRRWQLNSGDCGNNILRSSGIAPGVSLSTQTASCGDATNGSYQIFTTAASSGVDTGFYDGGSNWSRWGRNNVWQSYVNTDATTNRRIVAGMVDSTSIGNWMGSDTPNTIRIAAFQQSATLGVAGDWYCFLANAGGGAAHTQVDTTISVSAGSPGTLHFLEIREDSSGFRFYIDSAEVCAGMSQTNKPTGTTNGVGSTVTLRTTSATVMILRAGFEYMEADK